jgi:hypothetical protein
MAGGICLCKIKTKIYSICYCEPEAHPPMVEVRTIKYERK